MKAAAWFSALLPAAALADGLVGSIIPPYPAGLVNEQGACIAECDFSIGILEDASSTPKSLFGILLVPVSAGPWSEGRDGDAYNFQMREGHRT